MPATKPLRASEIRSAYELNTGHAIIRRFAKLDPMHFPGVLVTGHAPFCWGLTPAEAAHNAVSVEETAAMAFHTIHANPRVRSISKQLLDKHFFRKHGAGSYYGQEK